ncbi:MAG TPA: excalibur calcium-binding domain-containing protein [Devosia sp.]|uniref:excalibur calcium-binding domain-containing protein n=1 Tax=Devosia sp. TaxID=1871048 RepID=UPI002F93A76E
MASIKTVAAVALLLMATIAAASAQGDMDCGDFGSWEEAQAFFEASGPGDPHGLDRDNGGIACESLN